VSARHHDLVPLVNRMTLLQVVRTVTLLWVACAPAVTHTVDARQGDILTVVAFLSLVAGAIVEVVRRRRRVRGLVPVWTLLLTDAVVVTCGVVLTGGPGSPVMPLVYLAVLSTVLLVSYRAGLQLAIWYALLLCGAHALALSGVFGSAALASANAAGGARSGIAAGAVLVVTSVATLCSALNERRLRERGHELAGLVRFGHALDHVATAEEVLAGLVAHVHGELGFTRVAACLDRPEGPAVVAPPVPARSAVLGEPPADGPHAAATAHRAPRCLASLDADHVLAPLLPATRNVVVVELAVDDVHLGIVVAEWGGQSPRIPAATVDALAQCVAHASLAVRNVTLLSEVRRLASHDSLTGLPNRRVFDDTLRREAERQLRQGQPYALVLVDVDHFKSVNDRYGHAAGDAVLRSVAQALAETCRGADLAARYGGEEFAVLLPGCGELGEALATAERLRAAVATRAREHGVTVSAGVALAPLHAADPASLVAAADAALYRAKGAGRDRSEVAGSDLADHAAGRNTDRTQLSSLFLKSM
jgi:two-component system cell cycle response regulator